MKSKPRKTKPKSSKLSQVHRSQKALLRAVRGLTEEIGHLRQLLLEIRGIEQRTFEIQRSHKVTQEEREAAARRMRETANPPNWYPKYYEKDGLLFKNVPYSPTDSIDSPQPKL